MLTEKWAGASDEEQKKEAALWQTGEDGFLLYDVHSKGRLVRKKSAECRFFCKEKN